MTNPRSKNRTPPRKTKRKSAASQAATTKAPPAATAVTDAAVPVRTFSTFDAAAEWFLAQQPDPSTPAGAYGEYHALQSKRLRENPFYVCEIYRRYRNWKKPPPEWVLKRFDKWVAELFDNPRQSMDDIMGLSGRSRGKRPAINEIEQRHRTMRFFWQIAMVRYFGLSMDRAAEIVCTLAANQSASHRAALEREPDPEKRLEIEKSITELAKAWYRNSITSERLSELYGKWPERSAAESYTNIVMRKWTEDRRSEFVKEFPSALVPKNLEYLYNLPSKK